MKLLSITEATTEWIGELTNYLGSGTDWSVNLGTGNKNRQPMLYIKIPLELIQSAIRKIEKNSIIWAQSNSMVGNYISSHSQEQLKKIYRKLMQNSNNEVYINPKLTHVGESHITISMGAELDNALGKTLSEKIRKLESVKINGISIFDLKAKAKIDSPLFLVFRSGFYKDDADPSGPLLVALNIETDLYSVVRVAVGLPAKYKTPDGMVWKQHSTVGYIAKRNLIHSMPFKTIR